MKVCVPVKENQGLESIPYNHFGSAPIFLIYNLENGELKEINNNDLHHQHGMCQPLKALSGEQVDVILVAGIGAGALMKLQSQGIKVYKVGNGSISDNIQLLKENQLMEFSTQNSCNHHGCGH